MKLNTCFQMIVLSLLCCLGQVQAQSNASAHKQPYSIVFNEWYHAGKERSKGPYHKTLLFTWFTKGTSAANLRDYRALIKRQRENGVKFIGYAYSATTAAPPKPKGHSKEFPEAALPSEGIKYSWVVRYARGRPLTWKNQKNRFFLDVGIRQVQDAVLNRVISNAKHLGCNALYLDNWYYNNWSPPDMSVDEWTKKCVSFILRARELTERNNLKLVVNTSSPPKNWPEFAMHVDGISYELPAHPEIVKRKSGLKRELDSYERVMALGKSIFLITDRLVDKGQRWDEDGRKVAATAMLVVPEDQPYWGGIYVCPPRYEVWPVGGWPMWPEQLGKPLGPRQWNGNTVTRKFERGSISITASMNPEFKVSFEY